MVCKTGVKSILYTSNFKYIGLTIKYINFELIHYIINLNIVLSFMIFNNFDYIFL